jgi:hypothetical protein
LCLRSSFDGLGGVSGANSDAAKLNIPLGLAVEA